MDPPAVAEGDEVFILTKAGGDCIGVGRAKVDAATAGTMERGGSSSGRERTSSRCVSPVRRHGTMPYGQTNRLSRITRRKASGSSARSRSRTARGPRSPTPAARTASRPCSSS
ncbi:hypothetical protein [Methanoculleus chikugoensis]|uniref:hypothetical protein n=1 Tax=Methanoculleus chikugoensis TaxID=118126 RepID=UPI001FB47EC9|nr:hypothetical protein [Methanoculleus chikugoensis]